MTKNQDLSGYSCSGCGNELEEKHYGGTIEVDGVSHDQIFTCPACQRHYVLESCLVPVVVKGFVYEKI